MEHIQYLGFTLVAGGLGERLGYSSIKVGLPVSLLGNEVGRVTYLQYYINYIQAFEERAKENLDSCFDKDTFYLPLFIMTSGDTHDLTVKLLQDNNNYGAKEGQITLHK